ncbi:MAG: hypothetical protein ACR2OT_03535 [Parvibaculales bacterium]
MDNEYQSAIEKLCVAIEEKERDLLGMKKTANTLCALAESPPVFQIEDLESQSFNIRHDSFFGIPLASAVKKVLEIRGDSKKGGRGATTVNEIFKSLKDGGFAFETKNDNNAKRNLRISLTKNSALFIKVPSSGTDVFGLRSWYPNTKAPKPDSEKNEPATKMEETSDNDAKNWDRDYTQETGDKFDSTTPRQNEEDDI